MSGSKFKGEFIEINLELNAYFVEEIIFIELWQIFNGTQIQNPIIKEEAQKTSS